MLRQQIELKLKTSNLNYEAYLAQIKQRVLAAPTPQDRHTWLTIQAIIEGIINQSQKPQSGV